MLERIQKILSARGIASRRKAEEYILAGLVKVNGKVAELGQKADAQTDTIEVDGKVVQDRLEMLYLLYYKPVGVVTSNASLEGHRTLATELPAELLGKVFPVGRLDKDSEGLLLLTNDGPLTLRLTHPRYDHDKEYEVTTVESLYDSQFKKLGESMIILGDKTKPVQLKRMGPNKFRITLTEGKNRQIRRMVEKVGGEVLTLKRIRIMTLMDMSLKAGQLRKLTDRETKEILASVGL